MKVEAVVELRIRGRDQDRTGQVQPSSRQASCDLKKSVIWESETGPGFWSVGLGWWCCCMTKCFQKTSLKSRQNPSLGAHIAREGASNAPAQLAFRREVWSLSLPLHLEPLQSPLNPFCCWREDPWQTLWAREAEEWPWLVIRFPTWASVMLQNEGPLPPCRWHAYTQVRPEYCFLKPYLKKKKKTKNLFHPQFFFYKGPPTTVSCQGPHTEKRASEDFPYSSGQAKAKTRSNV